MSGGLVCPNCGWSSGFAVKDSRVSLGAIRRRKECLVCGERVTTYECIADEALVESRRGGDKRGGLMVVLDDNSRESRRDLLIQAIEVLAKLRGQL